MEKAVKNRDLFIWIPKTAGTSIFKGMVSEYPYFRKRLGSKSLKVLGASGTHGHVKVDTIYTPKQLATFNIFTVVRDPYSRFISLVCYEEIRKLKQHRRKRSPGRRDRKMLLSGIPKIAKKDILRTISRIERGIPPVGRYNEKGLSQFNTQFSWIRNIENVKVYKFENLQELSDDFHITIHQLNKSVDFDYREAIDPDIKKFIDDYYDIDFTHFGYEKEIK